MPESAKTAVGDWYAKMKQDQDDALAAEYARQEKFAQDARDADNARQQRQHLFMANLEAEREARYERRHREYMDEVAEQTQVFQEIRDVLNDILGRMNR